MPCAASSALPCRGSNAVPQETGGHTYGLLLATDEHLSCVLLVRAFALPYHSVPLGSATHPPPPLSDAIRHLQDCVLIHNPVACLPTEPRVAQHMTCIVYSQILATCSTFPICKGNRRHGKDRQMTDNSNTLKTKTKRYRFLSGVAAKLLHNTNWFGYPEVRILQILRISTCINTAVDLCDDKPS